jgi:transcriptional regulator with XRE-family HTH domain
MVRAKNIRDKTIDFLNKIQAQTGMSFHAISIKAGLASSTVNRFIKTPALQEISLSSLNKIAKVAGYKSYEDFYVQTEQNSDAKTNNIKIEDSQKFEIYEMVKKLYKVKNPNGSLEDISNISQEVIKHAYMLNTNFISESLVMYVIEKIKIEK